MTPSQRSARRASRFRASLPQRLGVLAIAASGTALAQSDKSIRFILPVATASGVDTITRAASPALSKALGHPIVVDNQPGAGGVVERRAAGQVGA